MRKVIFGASAAIAIISTSSSAVAQTLSYADAMQRLASTCGSDIQKYCKGVNLGRDQLKNCLTTNQSKMSPSCTTGWSSVFASLQKRAVAQATVLQVCDADIRSFCGGVQPGDGQILDCMTLAIKRVNPACRQTILDTGWL